MRQSTQIPAASQPPEVAAQKILLVDDNVDAADTLALLLQLDGHEVATVYEAAQALEKVKTFKPNVVLLDIGLPGMAGYELAARLRSIPELNGMQRVALTGYGKSEHYERTKAAGFDDHLVKPVEALTLQQALAKSNRTC